MNAYAVFCIAIVCLMIGAVIGLFAGALASVSKDRADCDTDLEKNRKRTWGKPDADGVIEHVRGIHD